MKKIEMKWGGGDFNIVLDLRSRNVLEYSSETAAASIHATYGGKNYYRSLSGASGAGWIPALPWVRILPTYRVDMTSPDFGLQPDADGKVKLPTVLGKAIWAPIDYRGAGIPHDYPFLVEEGDRFVATDRYMLAGYLAGKVPEVETPVSISFIRSTTSDMETKKWTVLHANGDRFTFQNLRRALEGRFIHDLAFEWPTSSDGGYNTTLNFWKRLGLHLVSGAIYKISGRIARKRYTREELSTVETLQVAVPANVTVLTPTCYLQEKLEGQFDAVGLFEFEGVTEDFEITLELPEAVRAMQGQFEEIVGRLREGAENKIRQAAEFRREQEKHTADLLERDQQFKRLCEEHAELAVTVQDSTDAGNCIPGTEDFRQRSFPSRDSVTVGELVRFVAVPGVRRVLEHKLQPFIAVAA
ncbi:MAG: hypothetical protein ABI430_03030 [Candidatus Taylorbacteria bacterium]